MDDIVVKVVVVVFIVEVEVVVCWRVSTVEVTKRRCTVKTT